jgi:hypothetical protein
MLLQGPVAYGVWRLLEELYLDSASKQGASEYAGLSETEKHTTLKDFERPTLRRFPSVNWRYRVAGQQRSDRDSIGSRMDRKGWPHMEAHNRR